MSVEVEKVETLSVLFGEGLTDTLKLYPSFPMKEKYNVIMVDAPW